MILLLLMKVVDVVFTIDNHEMSFMWLLLCQKRKLQELMLKVTRCGARLESGIQPRKSNVRYLRTHQQLDWSVVWVLGHPVY